MAPGPEDVLAAPSPGGDSVVSSKRDHSPPPSGDAASKKKKTTAGAGSRGVANLTPEQLAKKRENDREAQRNIRRRTKEQIETLERQIQELQSQQPYQELMAMKRAKEAVEKENVEMKARLRSIAHDLQGLIGPAELPRPYASPAPPPGPVHATTPASTTSSGSAELHSWQAQAHQSEQAKVQLQQQRHDMRHGLDMGPERLGLDFLLGQNQRPPKIQTGVNGAQDTARWQHIPMKHDWTDVRNDQALRGRGASAGTQLWEPSKSRESSVGAPSTSTTHAHRPAVSDASQSAMTPPWSMQIKNCGPTCPLDSILLDFLGERRQRAAEGLPAQEVVGPRYPSVSSLLNPAHSAMSHPLSKVFTDILSTFPDISTLPERVGVLYIMFLLMRWQISPTQENFDRLPHWVRPQPAQLQYAHPAWIDHLPWPAMREKLAKVYTPHDYHFENFFIPFTTTIRVGWGYEETDTLLQNPDSEELMVNPVFERHLRNLDNWSLGEPFAKAFPGLIETCRIDYSVKGAKTRQ
ncbi:uncharacterized protein F5Z01DRAFT_507633 [Emericellopsis atlantica]|uniref:BZIP transcription factor n=1 Tax=Emericellopsis atlantica TaxID=2614577 RepID=A0A9P8CQW5_9HYPO|nr:uncharacterized protein F5Z01DRAFT_507633 [Emericellopsis atlantica]KAG9256379.1 hypothetical protein F5Z01DRAFT_507633 [Emericellopsis atlantica]